MYIYIHAHIYDIFAQNGRKNKELFGFKILNIVLTFTNVHINPKSSTY